MKLLLKKFVPNLPFGAITVIFLVTLSLAVWLAFGTFIHDQRKELLILLILGSIITLGYGLILYQRWWQNRLAEANRLLIEKNTTLNDFNKDLDRLVLNRTMELDASRIEAWVMMEKADEERRRLEDAHGALKLQQEALERSEVKYRSLVESIPDIIWTLNSRFEVVFVSPNSEAIIGFTPKEIYADNLNLGVGRSHPEDQPAVQEALNNLFHYGAAFDIECRYQRKDGQWIWISMKATRTYEENGEHFASGTLRDITLKKELEKKLTHSEEQYRLLFENSPHPMWIFDRHTFRFLAVNGAVQRQYGYSRDEFLSMTVMDIRLLEDREKFKEKYKTILSNIMKNIHANNVGIWRHQKKDGTLIDVEVAWAPLIFEGHEAGLVLLNDVTQRLKMEKDLVASEGRFRQVAEYIRNVFWMTDLEKNKMIYISPAYEQIWGRTCESLYKLPLTWAEAIHPDDRSRVLEAAMTKQVSGEYDEEYRIIRPDGTIRWIWDKAFPVRNDAGQAYRVVGIAEDITEKKILEERMRHAVKMKALGQFVAGLVHEINNPLGIISSNAQYLRGILGENDTRPLNQDGLQEMKEGLELIQDNARRCGRITSDLLSFSRQEDAGDLKPIDITESLKAILKIMGKQFELSGIRMDVELERIPPVPAHGEQIQQVFMNILINAMQATPPGGFIRIRNSKTKDGKVMIEVIDTGRGIEPQHLDHVFEPFFTTKPTGIGTGLGLPISYSIIKKHGGEIRIESKLGQGTRVQVIVPAG